MLRPRQKFEKRTTLLGYKTAYLHFPARNSKGTLVCFHGWLDNAASFIPLAEELHDYEIFSWDFLGHGKSAHKHAGERYHYVDLIPFVEAALESTGRKDVILTGHSMGAGASSLYAGAIKKNIKALFLIEGFSPLTSSASEAAQVLAEGVAGFKKALALPKPVYKNLEDALKIRMRVNSLSREGALDLVKRAIQKVEGGVTWRADFRLRAPSLLRMSDEQVKAIVSQIDVPTLLILGDAGMKELYLAAQKNPRLIPQMRLEKLPGHHHLHLENAKEVAATFRRFMESL